MVLRVKFFGTLGNEPPPLYAQKNKTSYSKRNKWPTGWNLNFTKQDISLNCGRLGVQKLITSITRPMTQLLFLLTPRRYRLLNTVLLTSSSSFTRRRMSISNFLSKFDDYQKRPRKYCGLVKYQGESADF